MLVALAVFTVLVAGVRNHGAAEVGLLLGVLAVAGLAARWLGARTSSRTRPGSRSRPRRRASASRARRPDGRRARSRWASQNREKG